MNEKLQKFYTWLSLVVFGGIVICMFCTRTDRPGSGSVRARIQQAAESLDQAERKQQETISRIESAQARIERIKGIADDNGTIIKECQESIDRCQRIISEARSRGKETKN